MLIGRHSAVVVAFDGLLVDTLPLRTQAIVEGIVAAGFPAPRIDPYAHVAGRTIAEAVRETVMATAIDADETSIDIATHRAGRVCTETMRGAVMLADGAPEWIQRVSSRVRIVIRSDSAREQVERLLESSGIAMHVTVVRCSDDVATRPLPASSFVESYDAIAERLSGLGVVGERIRGLESAPEALCSRVTSVRIRRVMSVTEVSVDALQLY